MSSTTIPRSPSGRVKRGLPFWDRIIKAEGCWEWQGARHPQGYGQLRIDGKVHWAHRRAYEFLGTHRDNALDKIQKGRDRSPRGHSHPRGKFSNDTIALARQLSADGLNNLEVAARTGISPSYVCRILQGARR